MKTPHSGKSIGRSPLRRGSFFIALALACFVLALVPKVFGFSPAPDGGYPGANTAEGTNTLLKLTSGIANTAVGALFQGNGNNNVALGADAGANIISASHVTCLGAGVVGGENVDNSCSRHFRLTRDGSKTAFTEVTARRRCCGG